MGAYFVYGFAGFILITSLPALAAGIYLLSKKYQINEAHESGWPHLFQGASGLLGAIFFTGIYYHEYLSAFWSFLLVSFISLPSALYRIWKIRSERSQYEQ